MPHKTHQNTTIRDKTHKYLKFDYLTSLCVVDHICIFISSKMVAQYMYASKRSLVIWVLKLTKQGFNCNMNKTLVGGTNVLCCHFVTNKDTDTVADTSEIIKL